MEADDKDEDAADEEEPSLAVKLERLAMEFLSMRKTEVCEARLRDSRNEPL